MAGPIGPPSLGTLGASAADPALGATATPPPPPISEARDPAALDPAYQDEAAILDLVNRKMREWERGRENIIISAHRNILYFRGHQWIIYNRALGRFAPRDLKPGTPRPVTNRYASCIAAYMSVLARVEPQLTFRPSTDDPDDRATADVAYKVMPVILDEVNVRLVRQHLAAWAALTPGAWLEWGYDPDPSYGTTMVPDEQCYACGNVQPPDQGPCAECGSQMLMPAMDTETGAPTGTEEPVGKMYCEVVPCFEMYFDPAVPDWTRQTRYIRRKALALDDAKQRWREFADRIVPDTMGTLSELYESQLPTLGPNLGDQRRGGVFGSAGGPYNTNQQLGTRVTETWYWSLPDDTYKEGLLAIVLGKTMVVKATPLPYSAPGPNGSTEYLLPHVHFPEQIVPGTSWSKTPADDLALLQDKRNQIESIILMIMQRMSNPVWLVPEGSNIAQFTGDPGQILRYNPLGPSPRPPERVPGQGVPAGFMTYLSQIDRDMEDAASTFEVVKGARPEGVSAGIALQMLQERAMSRFGAQFILWEQAWARCGHLALQIFRQFVTEERLLRIQGKDGRWEVEKFLGADLTGQVDVVAEAGSALPRSTLSDRAETEQLIGLGVVNRMDPEVQRNILEQYNRLNLMPAMKSDSKNAIMENETFAALAQDPQAPQAISQVLQFAGQQSQMTGMPVPYNQLVAMLKQQFGVEAPRVRAAVDNHAIHANEHANELKGEDAQEWPLPVQYLLESHLLEHRRLLQQEQMQQMAMQGGQLPYLSNPGGQGGMPGQQQQQQQAGRMQGEQQEMQGALQEAGAG